MPKVGTKQFPYTPEGIAMAKAEARMTGLPMVGETPLVENMLREEEGGRTRNKKARRGMSGNRGTNPGMGMGKGRGQRRKSGY